ncbi:hypothetical protein CMQ_4795 [Grosmannia clavigera kw1407]|uniref:Uncharacterized protein n=1 Tax=Grosmannia clavigera (strain kw1407 / UAMH 11150) TaxID=655863 RepID=F0XTX3_GROCL|nr:uncharacterized protein CMQ_4795 [Grosmannia clavigera kw1407]EFW98943.1 hypothetical protein CMQ_4795 [Grosmannia clavigera kw1407]
MRGPVSQRSGGRTRPEGGATSVCLTGRPGRPRPIASDAVRSHMALRRGGWWAAKSGNDDSSSMLKTSPRCPLYIVEARRNCSRNGRCRDTTPPRPQHQVSSTAPAATDVQDQLHIQLDGRVGQARPETTSDGRNRMALVLGPDQDGSAQDCRSSRYSCLCKYYGRYEDELRHKPSTHTQSFLLTSPPPSPRHPRLRLCALLASSPFRPPISHAQVIATLRSLSAIVLGLPPVSFSSPTPFPSNLLCEVPHTPLPACTGAH